MGRIEVIDDTIRERSIHGTLGGIYQALLEFTDTGNNESKSWDF